MYWNRERALLWKKKDKEAEHVFPSYRFRAFDPVIFVGIRVLEGLPKDFGDGLVAPDEQTSSGVLAFPTQAAVPRAFGVGELLMHMYEYKWECGGDRTRRKRGKSSNR